METTGSVAQKVVPFLWFDINAEEMENFYTSCFKNSEVTNISHYGAKQKENEEI